MPRNGSGVYSHPFPDVVEGTTIESAVFNGNTDGPGLRSNMFYLEDAP